MAALVCGGVAFSMERENQTDDFLARLPLSGTKLNRVKIATAAVYFLGSYIAAIAMAAGLFALFFDGHNLLSRVGERDVLGYTALVAFLLPVVCFLWSVMFSRYIQTTLSVVLFAALATLLTPPLLFGTSGAIAYWTEMPAWLHTCLFGGLFLTQISLMVYAIARRPESWLRPSSIANQGADQGVSVTTIDTPVKAIKTKTSYLTSMRALLWQTYRFKWLGSLVALLACGLYLTTMLSCLTALLAGAPPEVGSVTIEFANDIFAAVLGGATGLFLFSKDQAKSSFLFFQQQADYPRRIWLARIIQLAAIGLIVVIVISIVNRAMFSTVVAFSQTYRIAEELGGSAYGFSSNFYDLSDHLKSMQISEWSYYFSLTLRSATMFFVVAAVGQLVSIFCRHGILNALLGVAFCTMSAIWVRYVNWYQVPAWSLAWPIGIAAFALSWSYAPSWTRGTRQFRWSLMSTFVMIGVSSACIFGMRRDRLNDYPIQPSFADLNELYESPEKLKSNGDPRFEIARQIDEAVRKIELAQSKIDDEGKGSKTISNTPQKFTAAKLQLVQNANDSFAKLAKLVQDPAARYYFYQSPDAADQIRVQKHDTIGSYLELYRAAAQKGDDSLGVRSALFAELAFATNNGFPIFPERIKNLLNWADTEAQTSEEILPLIDQLENLFESYFSPNNLAWLESNSASFQSQLKSSQATRLGYIPDQ